MKHLVKLYISGKEVDCSESLSLPITYSLEDLNNPTIVKNSFSKTISVPATKNNNKIFGEFFKLDRMQHYEEWTGNPELNGINFDPSKRADFAIYVNGEIVESGYCQLNDVSIQNEVKAYNITLYGGLGDFFYNLKYNEDGTKKTLADLRYFITDEDGQLLPKDSEMNFVINKEFVDKCYSQDWSNEGSKITDTITFIPANNGVYEKFDSSHCLINTNGDTVFPKTLVDRSDPQHPVTYVPKNGFGFASLEKDYTEWEVRDLRSYQQRPAIKLSKLIEAICNKDNSGYKVTFDPSFFNANNPYWDKTFVALPLLGTTSEDASTKEAGKVSGDDPMVGNSGTTITSATSYVSVTAPNITTTSNIIDMSAYPVAATFNMDIDFSIEFVPREAPVEDTLYIASRRTYTIGRNTYYRDYYQSLTAQVIAYDADTNDVLGYSDMYYFNNSAPSRVPSGSNVLSNPADWLNYTPRTAATAVPVNGSFKRQPDGRFFFVTYNGDNTMKLTLNKVPRADRVKIALYIDWQRNDTRCDFRLFNTRVSHTDADEAGYYGNEFFRVLDNQDAFEIVTENPILSGATITKDMILKTENSPADFLLSYSKIFGLYFIKDVVDKKITILSRPKYFNSNINNWDHRIDKSKNMTVTPILFDKKWYLMSLETPETYFATKYKSKYNMTYGQKRLNTGYNFNSETTKLYDENIYQNVVTGLDSDKYFRTFFSKSNAPVPCFVNDNISYTLYNGNDGYDSDIYGVNIIDVGKTREWSSLGKDLFPKQCFFSLSSDERDLEEISTSLVFYNGTIDLKDSFGNPVKFWLTDDLREMSALNDGEMCFLYTNSEFDEDGNRIAIPRTSLPQYISYITKPDNSVKYSLDFGLPKEIYTNYTYNENSTIYNQFWQAFYTDQFDINTKKVTCYVRLDDLKVNSELLREFYYFDNSYWLLNKIDSYDVNSTATVRCEFIKVQDTNNYTGGIAVFGQPIPVTYVDAGVKYNHNGRSSYNVGDIVDIDFNMLPPYSLGEIVVSAYDSDGLVKIERFSTSQIEFIVPDCERLEITVEALDGIPIIWTGDHFTPGREYGARGTSFEYTIPVDSGYTFVKATVYSNSMGMRMLQGEFYTPTITVEVYNTIDSVEVIVETKEATPVIQSGVLVYYYGDNTTYTHNGSDWYPLNTINQISFSPKSGYTIKDISYVREEFDANGYSIRRDQRTNAPNPLTVDGYNITDETTFVIYEIRVSTESGGSSTYGLWLEYYPPEDRALVLQVTQTMFLLSSSEASRLLDNVPTKIGSGYTEAEMLGAQTVYLQMGCVATPIAD